MSLVTPNFVKRLLGRFSSTAAEVGEWPAVAGAKIYRKVLTASAGPNGSVVSLAHGLTLANVQLVRAPEVVYRKGSDKTYVFGPVTLGDTVAHSVTTEVDATNVTLTSPSGGTDLSGYAVVVVLEYAVIA